MKSILRKKKISTISTILYLSSQKKLVKREENVVVKRFNDQKIIEIIDAQKIS